MGKFGSRNSKLPVLPNNLHTEYLEDCISYSDISFLNFQPLNFWTNLGQNIQTCLFAWKFPHRISRGYWLLFPLYFPGIPNLNLEDANFCFDISFLKFQPKSIFWANLSWKSRIVYFVWKLPHEYLEVTIARTLRKVWKQRQKWIIVLRIQ